MGFFSKIKKGFKKVFKGVKRVVGRPLKAIIKKVPIVGPAAYNTYRIAKRSIKGLFKGPNGKATPFVTATGQAYTNMVYGELMKRSGGMPYTSTRQAVGKPKPSFIAGIDNKWIYGGGAVLLAALVLRK